MKTPLDRCKREYQEVGSGATSSTMCISLRNPWVKRHLGILYHLRGEYDQAVTFFSESVQTYRERHSINGLLRTFVLFAECLYGAERRTELQNLAPEIDIVAAKSSLGEWVVRWRTLQGHMLLDEALEHRAKLDQVVEKYGEALIRGLEWNSKTLDTTVERLCWRLGLLTDTPKESEAILIVQGLVDFWKNGEINQESLVEYEHARRSDDSQMTQGTQSASKVLARFEVIIGQGLHRSSKPTIWEGL